MSSLHGLGCLDGEVAVSPVLIVRHGKTRTRSVNNRAWHKRRAPEDNAVDTSLTPLWQLCRKSVKSDCLSKKAAAVRRGLLQERGSRRGSLRKPHRRQHSRIAECGRVQLVRDVARAAHHLSRAAGLHAQRYRSKRSSSRRKAED